MIINKFGRVVVPVGETFVYDGAEYRCEVYYKTSNTDVLCNHCALAPLGEPCMSLSCSPGGRLDGEYVVFVKQEGGEDESK